MNYQIIKKHDIANGPGIRTSIWFCGCTLKCKGCFNSEIWKFDSGIKFTEQTKATLFDLLRDVHCKGLSILGGEPTDQGDELVELVKSVKEYFPQKDIWMWTGRTLQELIDSGNTKLFPYLDVIVDGPFKEEESGLNLKFRGSKNQNIWYKINNIWTVQN